MYSALNICTHTHTLAHQYMCSVPDQGQVILYCRRVPWPQQSVRFVAVVAAVDSWSLARAAAAADSASAAPQLRLPLLICWFHFGLFVSFVFVFVFADFNAKPSGAKAAAAIYVGGTKFIWQLNLSAVGRRRGGLEGARAYSLLNAVKLAVLNFYELQLIARICQE